MSERLEVDTHIGFLESPFLHNDLYISPPRTLRPIKVTSRMRPRWYAAPKAMAIMSCINDSLRPCEVRKVLRKASKFGSRKNVAKPSRATSMGDLNFFNGRAQATEFHATWRGPNRHHMHATSFVYRSRRRAAVCSTDGEGSA